jgi:hypothetical protein
VSGIICCDAKYTSQRASGYDLRSRLIVHIYDDALNVDDGSYRDEIAQMVEDSGYAHMCSEDFVEMATMGEFARRWYTKVKLDLYLTPT